MFTLAISCLTTSNLPWFMDLTFQVHLQYCCLQSCKTLFSPPVNQWVVQPWPTLCNPMDCSLSISFLHPWNFPDKSTGAGCHFLLQGIFLTQGLNPGLPYYRQTLYRLSYQRSHRHIHNWVSFLLWLSLFILSGAISPLFPSSILDTSCPGRSSPISYLFAFS